MNKLNNQPNLIPGTNAGANGGVRSTELDGLATQHEAERAEIDKQTLDNAMKKYVHQQRFQQAQAWTQ